MKIPRLNTWLLFGLPIVAIFCGVCAVTDPSVTDLDNPAITQRVCGDYPPGQAPPDCVSSQDVLTNTGDDDLIERPFWAVVAVLVLLAWVAILVADWRAKRKATKMPAHDYPTPLLLLWQADTLSTSGYDVQWGSLLLVGTIIAVLVLIVYFGVRAAKKRKARETPPATLGKPQR